MPVDYREREHNLRQMACAMCGRDGGLSDWVVIYLVRRVIARDLGGAVERISVALAEALASLRDQTRTETWADLLLELQSTLGDEGARRFIERAIAFGDRVAGRYRPYYPAKTIFERWVEARKQDGGRDWYLTRQAGRLVRLSKSRGKSVDL